MKFKINNEEWEIKEVSQEEICEHFGEEYVEDGNYYLGTTEPTKKMIYLYKDLDNIQKRKTLIHELTHCYLFIFVSFNNIQFSIDDFCDLHANSHDIIHNIVEKYFNKGE